MLPCVYLYPGESFIEGQEFRLTGPADPSSTNLPAFSNSNGAFLFEFIIPTPDDEPVWEVEWVVPADQQLVQTTPSTATCQFGQFCS